MRSESYDALERRFNHAVTRRIPLIVYAFAQRLPSSTNILPFHSSRGDCSRH